jgi:hypothetical protein
MKLRTTLMTIIAAVVLGEMIQQGTAISQRLWSIGLCCGPDRGQGDLRQTWTQD